MLNLSYLEPRQHYVGKPCKRCGCRIRYTSTRNCIPCARAAAAKAKVRNATVFERSRRAPRLPGLWQRGF